MKNVNVVLGIIPTWLEGKLLRIGPGNWLDSGEDFSMANYFDGFAMVSKFDIKNGKVSYCQRMIESESYQKAKIVKRPVFAEFGTHAYPDTTKGFLFRMFSTLVPTDLTDNNIAAIYRIEDEMIISSQTCFVHSIDVDSLATKERHDLMKSSGTMFTTAHPLTDSDGNSWNIGATMLTGCKYHLIKIPFIGSGKASDALKSSKVIATIQSSWKTCLSFISSFAMTENYVIFMESPLLINCVKLAQLQIKHFALRDTFEWTPSEKNRFIVVEKETGNVIKTRFISDLPFFSIHHCNAFERDDQVVVDLIGYPNANILDKFNMSNLRQNQFSSADPPQTYRFVIPLIHYVVDVTEGENLVTIPDVTATAIKSGDAIVLKPQQIAEPGLELPVINARFAGKPYKYFYASGMYGESSFKNSICKINMETGKADLFKVGENEYCGEPSFIPKMAFDSDEDDGVVLVPVSCADSNKLDYLACLDSKTFLELGRVEFETKFLQALHGIFMWSLK
ncbi:hypothetical protein Fcan01_07859 [Folsomia candida]|uniref:Beta,beta-carotene 15,15'-monooxygenase n=1 Tax=Folsomia candida TaxID=158441 RepID=A0A226EJ66_FOLCA|nr:hypothetical protein Fcan01_07859 [Folsomia candida]